MNKAELMTKLDELIEFESERIREVFPHIFADRTTEEYRDNIGKIMRYMGKRDMCYYIKHLIEYG